MAEVQRADPAARRFAMIVLMAGFAAGLLLLWGLDAGRPVVARWLRDDPASTVVKARGLLALLAVLMAGPPALAGAYLFRFGTRVVRAERFPPPGVRMVQDTVVVIGEAAQRRGRIAQALGWMLMLTALAMVALLWKLAP